MARRKEAEEDVDMDPESEEESPGEEEDEASDDEMNGDVVEGSVVPFLDCFWNMSSTEGDTRSFAAASLAYHVTEHRTQHPGEDDILSKAPKEATSDSTTGDMSERDRIKAKAKALGTVDMAYALKRLVRGLCSSRGGARQGFATGLTLMMQRTTNAQMSVQNVYEVVREETTVTKGMRGAEERDLILGRLFGIAAIAHAHASTPSLSEDGSGDDEDDEITASNEHVREGPLSVQVAQAFLTTVMELYAKKKFIQEAAVTVVRDVLAACTPRPRNLNRTFTGAVKVLLEPLRKVLNEADVSQYTPECVALGLVVSGYVRDVLMAVAAHDAADAAVQDAMRAEVVDSLGDFPAYMHLGVGGGGASPSLQPWFTKEVIEALAEPLKLSTSTFPRPHSVWGVIFDELAPVGGAAVDDGREGWADEALQHLWRTVVDMDLLNGTHQMKGIALILLPMLAGRLPPQYACKLVTRVAMRTLTNATKSADAYLNSIAKDCLQQLAGTHPATNPHQWRLAMATQLITLSEGTVDFDTRTKTKTIQSLVEGLDEAAVGEYVAFLMRTILRPAPEEGGAGGGAMAPDAGGDESEASPEREGETRRLWALNALFSAARWTHLPSRATLLPRIVAFLVSLGLFDISSLAEEGDGAVAAVQSALGGSSSRSSKAKTPKASAKKKKRKDAAGDAVDALKALVSDADLADARAGAQSCMVLLRESIGDEASGNGQFMEVTTEFRAVVATRLFSLLSQLTSGPIKPASAAASEGGTARGCLEWMAFTHDCVRVLRAAGVKEECPLLEDNAEQMEEFYAFCSATLGAAAMRNANDSETRVSRAYLALLQSCGLMMLHIQTREESTMQANPAEAGSHAKRARLSKDGDDDADDARAGRGDGLIDEFVSITTLANDDEATEARREQLVELMSDLMRSYTDVLGSGAKGADAGGSDADDGEEEGSPDPLAVLADVCVAMLGLMADTSAGVSGGASKDNGIVVRGLREIVKQSFGLVCTCVTMTEDAVITLIEAITNENQEEALEEGDEDDELDGDSEDDDVDMNGDANGEDEEDDAESEEETEEHARSNGSKKRKRGGKRAEEESDGEADADADAIMVHSTSELADVLRGGMGNDEENLMEAMALQRMLALRKQMRPTKASRQQVFRAVFHHRLRALDLLEQVLRTQSSRSELILTVGPLIRAYGRLGSSSASAQIQEAKDLRNRIRGVCNKLFKVTLKFENEEHHAICEALVVELLRDILRNVPQHTRKDHFEFATKALGCLTRSLAAAGSSGNGEIPDELVHGYREALDAFAKKKTKMDATIFTELLNRHPTLAAAALTPALPAHALTAKTPFLRFEMFKLMAIALRRKTKARTDDGPHTPPPNDTIREAAFRREALGAACHILAEGRGEGDEAAGNSGAKSKHFRSVLVMMQTFFEGRSDGLLELQQPQVSAADGGGSGAAFGETMAGVRAVTHVAAVIQRAGEQAASGAVKSACDRVSRLLEKVKQQQEEAEAEGGASSKSAKTPSKGKGKGAKTPKSAAAKSSTKKPKTPKSLVSAKKKAGR